MNSLESLKDFIKHVALGMDGQRGYDSDSESDTDGECQCLPLCEACARKKWIPPCVESVRNYWKNFTGAWKRTYPENPIPEDVRESVTQVCQSISSHITVKEANSAWSSSMDRWRRSWSFVRTSEEDAMGIKITCTTLPGSIGRIGSCIQRHQPEYPTGRWHWRSSTLPPGLASILSRLPEKALEGVCVIKWVTQKIYSF